uniref:Uncharacterized protein n=1 Tax=Rhizophora mucronata TaxID=61149 RepID=A0A2P2QNT0_RHIMU
MYNFKIQTSPFLMVVLVFYSLFLCLLTSNKWLFIVFLKKSEIDSSNSLKCFLCIL